MKPKLTAQDKADIIRRHAAGESKATLAADFKVCEGTITYTLMVAGKLVHMPPRYFAALLCLVRRAGELVTKRELLDTAWPGQSVSDASLHVAIGVVRRALKCGASYPIETVPCVGYRFVGKVE